LANAMAAHAAVLSDPKVYRTIGNHGLNQDMGLLGLGCATANATWRNLAVQRIGILAARSIDAQGVTDEGSTLYENLNYVWYKQTIQRLKDCGQAVPAVMSRVDLMPNFLAQATMPNGQLVGLGDSDPVASIVPIPGTQEQYAASRGATGPPPTQTFSVYSRGYLFSRSTWAPNSPNASFLSLRFGQSRDEQVHGQNDATDVTFYALGKELLWENGLYGAGGGPFRSYVVGRSAQNTVDVPSVAYNPATHTRLLRSKTTTSYDTATVLSPDLVGVTVQRTVLHSKVGGFLVVDDQVTQAKSRTVIQRWQLAEGRQIFTSTARVSTSGPGTNATLMWVGTKPHLQVVSGQTKPTVLGWRSDHSNRIVPAPTVEASVNGKHVRMTMVLIPRSSSTHASIIKITHVDNAHGVRQFDVTTATGTYHVRISATSASVVKI
jgi:Heparinase II/III-like protein